MTDSTKQLFDAPWVVMGDAEDYIKFNVIISSPNSPRHCCTIASCIDQKTANRLARLPELYDALMDAAGGKCWACAGENTETMLDHPCPKGHDEDCYVAKWRELLRKVRDGE